ncbi:hypothetical protein F2Q70_00043363 [Brassica cretica]|uniref:Uncharacterized protein n=1 Tax=Brassica cretica TaxID=69181 RepID=A0A8S9KJK0_BRACR|nr:hypothetical protein F2Q70_00043363 [Brassica cretica]
MQKRDGTDQVQAEAAWERTRTSYPIDRAIRPSIDTLHQQSIDNNNATSIDKCPIPNTTVSEKDKFNNQFLTPDEFGIFMDPDGYAKVKEQRREIQEVRCRFEGYDAEQPSRTTRRLFPKRTSKLQAISRRINDPGIIAACHYGEDYEINYSASIETHTATSIDNGHQKSINISHDESVDSRPDDWESDYYNPIMAVNDATTEISDGLYDEELLNMQKRDGTDQVQAEVAWERTRTSHPIGRAIRPSIETLHQQSIDNNNSTSIDNRPIPNTTVSEKDKFDNQFLTPDEFGNGADNMFMHHRNNPGQKATKKFYDTAGGIDNSFIQKSRHPTQTSIDIAAPTSVARQPGFGRRAYDLYGNRKFYWEEKDEYGVYRDDRRYARDLDGNTIRLHNIDIRRLLERASRDEPNYICLPEHVNLFTQTKLVPEIYTKDEITEMFYEVCGEHKKNKEAF